MNHYFSDHQELSKNRRDITFRFLHCDFNFTVDDGVFSNKHVDYGTEALLKVAAKEEIQGSVADLGCGYGVIGVVISRLFNVEVQGFDVNSRSVDLANINFKSNNAKGNNIVQDGISGQFDWVITNPPIRVGKEKMYHLFAEAYEALNAHGTLLFVIRKQHGAKSAQAYIKELFGNCELLKKDKGFYIYKAIKN
ncbi:MAG TPA: methyltransferase [Erysipelothrix sp.]